MFSPRICVAGAGAVGGAVAGLLAAAGERVHLIARGKRLQQLRRDGLKVMRDGSAPIQIPLPASNRGDFGVQDVVFLAVKAHALSELVPQLGPLIGPHTVVVPLVNGVPWWYFEGTMNGGGSAVPAVDPDGVLLRSVPAQRIIGCVAFLTSHLDDTGVVRIRGELRLHIGEIAGSTLPRTRDLGTMLCRAGIQTSVSDHIRNELWTKVALNLATNPLSVVSGATLVHQFTDPRLLPVTTAILLETRRLAASYGASPTMSLDEMITTGRRAGDFETSMLQDYRAGRPLELGAIGRAVLDLADKVGEPMPTSRLIVDLAAYLSEVRRNSPRPA